MDRPSQYFRIGLLSLLVMTGCWGKQSPEPLSTQIKGTWRWSKTFDGDHKVVRTSSSSNSAHMKVRHMTYGSGFMEVVELYTDDIKVDSLYMPRTDNYTSSVQNGNEVFVNYIDSQKKPVVARFQFFFPKNKRNPNRMEVNFQKNTSEYKSEADTVIMEYFRDPM